MSIVWLFLLDYTVKYYMVKEKNYTISGQILKNCIIEIGRLYIVKRKLLYK